MTFRSTLPTVVCAALAALVLVPLAAGHAELNPDESPAGGFAKFVLHVENEEAAASTVKVVVRFPESVATATFARTPGWARTVTWLLLDQPVTDSEGIEIAERIVTVTWKTSTVKQPPEEVEFGFSFEVPNEPGATISFPTVQTYSDGTVVRWIGPPGSDEPAPGVLITEATGGGGGTTTVETESVPVETTTVAPTGTTAPATATAETTTTSVVPASSEDDDSSNLPLLLGLIALVAALAGLGYWLYQRDRNEPPPPGPGGPPPPDEQPTQRFNPPF